MTNKITIDKLKIPAFQRKKKIRVKKGSSFKVGDPLEIRQQVRLKKANIKAIRKNRSMDVDTPPVVNDAFPSPIDGSVQPEIKMPEWRKMNCIGEVTHYFSKIDVAILKLEKTLKIGEQIIVEAPKCLFEQKLSSMQIDRLDVPMAKKGDDVGIKVKFEPKINGKVYKVVAEG